MQSKGTDTYGQKTLDGDPVAALYDVNFSEPQFPHLLTRIIAPLTS